MMTPAHRHAGTRHWHPLLWLTIGAVLLVPMIAMRFTAEVVWDAADFAAAALLLVGGGLAFETGARLARTTGQRLAIGAAILLVVAFLWADAAVGIV